MKIQTTISLEPSVLIRAKAKYANLSGKINSLLKASLEVSDDDLESDEASLNAKLSGLNAERLEVEVKLLELDAQRKEKMKGEMSAADWRELHGT